MSSPEDVVETPTDDLPDTCRVIRVLRPSDLMPASDGKTRPKSSAFTDSRRDGAMSVFLEDDVIAAGKQPEDLLALDMFEPGSVLAYHELGYYRNNGQDVRRRPIDEFPGHANVRDTTGKRSGGIMTRMAKSARWMTGALDPAGEPSSEPQSEED